MRTILKTRLEEGAWTGVRLREGAMKHDVREHIATYLQNQDRVFSTQLMKNGTAIRIMLNAP